MSRPSKREVWLVSDDEERWSMHEEFPSREAALAGALDVLLQYDSPRDPGSTFWVGRKVVVDILTTRDWGAIVVDRLSEDAHEEVGAGSDDIVGDWPAATKAQVDRLTERVKSEISAWLTETGLQPTFYTVEKVTEHTLPEAAP